MFWGFTLRLAGGWLLSGKDMGARMGETYVYCFFFKSM